MTTAYTPYTGKRSGAASVNLHFANLSKWWKMRDYLRERHPMFCDAMERVDALPEVAPVWQRHWS